LTAKRWLDLLELGSHAVAAGPPFDQEAARRLLPQTKAKRRKVEGLALRPDFNGDIALIACFISSWTPAMVRRWHADPFGFLRPWNEVPALMGSAPPATPPATGTGVVTFLMG
jgi:hypothetical protein